MYHKAMQVLHKPGPKRPGKLRKGEISTYTDLKIKLGWKSAWVEVGLFFKLAYGPAVDMCFLPGKFDLKARSLV